MSEEKHSAQELAKRLRDIRVVHTRPDAYDFLAESASMLESQAERIAELEAELAKRQWISVKERLPFAQRMVLLYANPTESNWGIGYGWLDYAQQKFLHRVSHALPVEFENCTHWMPLPDPPKEQKE